MCTVASHQGSTYFLLSTLICCRYTCSSCYTLRLPTSITPFLYYINKDMSYAPVVLCTIGVHYSPYSHKRCTLILAIRHSHVSMLYRRVCRLFNILLECTSYVYHTTYTNSHINRVFTNQKPKNWVCTFFTSNLAIATSAMTYTHAKNTHNIIWHDSYTGSAPRIVSRRLNRQRY